ncbi:Cobalamin biosynthesis protein CobT [Candidatus Burkholderia pumila]|uniref:Cobalamin biosynthesis protein CobT n=1 Tax=Candidatus Burkholderia pumila TaxID=1090375 RepID=A0ABR5HLS2_9BURK|nr:Cobalamin biosynthesis protein CobT [Candidatus Burkholderia pumila]
MLLPEDLPDAWAVMGYIDMLVAPHTHCDADAIEASAQATRAIAQSIDDRRACTHLTDLYPGAQKYLRAMRKHRETIVIVLSRWNDMTWRERFSWRIKRLLWREQVMPAETGPSLDSAVKSRKTRSGKPAH